MGRRGFQEAQQELRELRRGSLEDFSYEIHIFSYEKSEARRLREPFSYEKDRFSYENRGSEWLRVPFPYDSSRDSYERDVRRQILLQKIARFRYNPRHCPRD
jgi:hypothetical protein